MSNFKEGYAAKLKHPNWQKMRLKILQRDKFTCLNCQSKDKTLHIHHSYYVKNRDPWRYPEYSLSTLCFECHEEEGKQRELGDKESGYSEIESTLNLFFNEDSQNCPSPALWELACLASELTNTAGVNRFAVEGAMIEGLLRLWKRVRKDKPPVWLGNAKGGAVPWASEWAVENFAPDIIENK